jgi:hypothetical protein
MNDAAAITLFLVTLSLIGIIMLISLAEWVSAAASRFSWAAQDRYVTHEPDEDTNEAETAGLSCLSAPSDASEPVEPDITPGDRAALIEALVLSGWTVGQIRSVVKGDNGAIGQEVEAARKRLEAPAPRRVVTIRNGVDGEVEL